MFQNFAFGSKQLLRNPRPALVSAKLSRTCCDHWKTSIFGPSSKIGHVVRRYYALSPKGNPITNFRQFSDRWRKGFCRGEHTGPNDGRNIAIVPNLALYSTLGVMVTVAYLSREEIPYSKRTRLILMPRQTERKVGDYIVNEFKRQWKVLPVTHPMSIKVTRITERVIEALKRGLMEDKNWGGPSYTSRCEDALKSWWEGRESTNEDDKIRRARHISQHFEVVNCWQVMVVDDPDTQNCFSYSNRTIVIYTGLLELLESDDELVTVIGHEIAHIIARHFAEMAQYRTGVDIIVRFWNSLIALVPLVKKISALPKYRSLRVKQELEADYIGMLLMASAGYDPRVAVVLLKQVGELPEHKDAGDDDGDQESLYPSYEWRSQCLSQALEEAITLYNESMRGHEKQ